ncbi:Dullard family phosphatase domain-containing protein [Cardiosporidium cionae]|uniref:Mitochondrial import inner membrane translocase subunit TIM50 n=1 Tax=Cardiosporidium cionae TaxID=476202 RepID=A0ABQ7JDI0_9APIC|nr:Dullard family phosphatase domain-containing protein [Cardiosporidium cionae]|eukprot:KAF8822026.1 Dullard family phosphatase domain-containing protein [Cardiosporidium cionae]
MFAKSVTTLFQRMFLFVVGVFMTLLEKLQRMMALCKNVASLMLRRRKFRTARKRRVLPGMTLVIDLDETLVLSTVMEECYDDPCIEIQINGKYCKFHVDRRPHVLYFLSQLYPLYEIVIYTAGRREYAEAVIGYLDIDQYIDKRLFREDCDWSTQKGYFIKNLKKVRDDVSKVILIDDSLGVGACFPGIKRR